MSEDSSFLVTKIISSEIFKSFKLSDLVDLKKSGNPDLVLHVPFMGTGNVGSIYKLSEFSLTRGQIISLLEKVEKIVLGTEKGMEQKLDFLFDDRKNKRKDWGTKAGDVRFYSPELACYYDGKSWRKLNIE
jgi:hypothetical protein